MKRTILIFACISTIVCGCTKLDDKAAEKSIEATSVDAMIEQAKAEIDAIKSKDFMALMEEGEAYILIDVRTESEHNAGFISGSINIPRGVLEFRIENESVWENEGMYAPLKEDLIIIYCKKGHRGALASQTLKQLGFTNIKNLSGGMLDWMQNFPEMVEKNETTGGAALPAAGGGGGC